MAQTVLSSQITTDLIALIQQGTLAANDKLPSERELSQQYHVSRNVVREAIKILVEKGLVTNVPGKGNYICIPTNSNLEDKLESALDLSHISMHEIIDARELLESSVMEKYLLKITKKQIRELEALYAKMEISKQNVVHFSEYDTQFHLYLIGCSNNQVLQLFLSTLYRMTRKNIITDSPNPSEVIKHSQINHREIIDAIKAKDYQRLSTALTQHIEPLRKFYK